MAEHRNPFWRMNKQLNHQELGAIGSVGTEPILAAIRDSDYELSTKQGVEQVLVTGWTTIRALFENGGIISGKGKVLSLGLEDSSLHPKLVEAVREDKFLSYEAMDIRDRYGLDIKTRGISSREHIYFLDEKLALMLGYYEGSLSPFLQLSTGDIEDLSGVSIALLRHFRSLYTQGQVIPLVPAATAVRQVLFQIAEESGIGPKHYSEVHYYIPFRPRRLP